MISWTTVDMRPHVKVKIKRRFLPLTGVSKKFSRVAAAATRERDRSKLGYRYKLSDHKQMQLMHQ